jgi:AcrR family transcriptional regulator
VARSKQNKLDALTADRIKDAAWALMAERGTAGLSLRGIARRLKVTAPAIYNYFSRLDDLVTALIVDAFTALAEAVEGAEAAVTSDNCHDKIVAICLAYREWAIEHPVRFQLIYGNPIPGYSAPTEITIPLARRPFLGVFRWFVHGYETGELRIPDEYRGVPPQVAAGIAAWKEMSAIEMPDPLVVLLMSGWSRIHGMVMLELFGHIQPLVGEGPDFFRHEIEAFAQQMGMNAAGELRQSL